MRRDVFLAVGCAYLGATATARAQTNGSIVRVSMPPDEDVVSCLYAMQSGIFRKLGLDVRADAATSGSAIAAAVAGGSIEVGKSSLPALIAAHVAGIPFTLVAPAALYTSAAPNCATIVRTDSPIRTARDLTGKIVGAQSVRGQNMLCTAAWIDSQGVDSKSVHFVEVPLPAMLAALDSGRIDAATLGNPTLSEALDSKKVRILTYPFDAVAKEFLLAAYFCSTDFASKNPDVVERFARALRQATAYTNSHRAQTVDLVSKFTSISPQIIAGMARVTCAETLDPHQIQPQIDLCVKYKLINAAFDARDLVAAVVK